MVIPLGTLIIGFVQSENVFFIFPIVQVEFNLSESQRTGFRKAVNVAVLRRNSEMRHKVRELFCVS